MEEILTEIHSVDQIEKMIESKDRDYPILLDFWSPTCAPCLAFKPHLRALQEKYTWWIVVCSCNAQEVPDLAARYMVSSLPTIMLFKTGETHPSYVATGLPSMDELYDEVNRAIDSRR